MNEYIKMKEISLKTRSVRGSATFMEAIRRARSRPQSKQAAELSTNIAGRILSGACWDDDKCAFLLSNGHGISFAASNQAVTWEVITEDQFESLRRSWPSDPETVRVSREGGDGRIWSNELDRAGISSRLIGKTVRRFGANELWVYIHFRTDRRYLKLRGEEIQGTHQPFLDWFEDED